MSPKGRCAVGPGSGDILHAEGKDLNMDGTRLVTSIIARRVRDREAGKGGQRGESLEWTDKQST